ncbi:MAG: sigma-70 family RNA polymerase sigma factor [Deltaproteobacteria bacterium]|nr:sigma-70 family RNA polymerase sigma factor [Deltaproteobacteria bacterium]
MGARTLVSEAHRAEHLALEFDEVYRAHAARVARWAALLGGARVDPADVVQDVFLVVERRLGSFRNEARLSTWLYRITANVARAHRRKARLREWFGRRFVEQPEPPAVSTPHEELERIEARRRVDEILSHMKEAHREVFVLFELEGASGAEIAERLGVSEDAVWVRLVRARKDFLLRYKRAQTRELAPRGRQP